MIIYIYIHSYVCKFGNGGVTCITIVATVCLTASASFQRSKPLTFTIFSGNLLYILTVENTQSIVAFLDYDDYDYI